MKRSTLIYLLVGSILLVSSRQQWRHIQSKGMIEKVLAPTVIDISSQQKSGSTVCFQQTCFAVEIADDDQEREIGLMNRSSLGYMSGMLFVFPHPGSYKFWMKNTLIPLDMLWLDSSGVVLEIATAVPCGLTGSFVPDCPVYGGKYLASYVLELNMGIAEKFDIKVGGKGIIDTK